LEIITPILLNKVKFPIWWEKFLGKINLTPNWEGKFPNPRGENLCLKEGRTLPKYNSKVLVKMELEVPNGRKGRIMGP